MKKCMAKTVTISGLSPGVTCVAARPTADTWLTVSVSGSTITVSCSANNGSTRTSTITVTASDGAKATLTVTQYNKQGDYSIDYSDDYDNN